MMQEMTEEDRRDRVRKLEEAERKLQEAVDLVMEATDDTRAEGQADAYFKGNVRAFARRENQPGSIPRLIDMVREDE